MDFEYCLLAALLGPKWSSLAEVLGWTLHGTGKIANRYALGNSLRSEP